MECIEILDSDEEAAANANNAQAPPESDDDVEIVGGAPAPWERRHCWEREGAPLDAARMRAAAALLLGSHDFSAFGFIDESGKSVADPRGPVRELRLWDSTREDEAPTPWKFEDLRLSGGPSMSTGSSKR